jgi:hypothetical protein
MAFIYHVLVLTPEKHKRKWAQKEPATKSAKPATKFDKKEEPEEPATKFAKEKSEPATKEPEEPATKPVKEEPATKPAKEESEEKDGLLLKYQYLNSLPFLFTFCHACSVFDSSKSDPSQQ